MRPALWISLLSTAALLALATALPKRTDQDFEFDDEGQSEGGAAGRRSPPRRYVFDPHNPLCRSLVCKKRELCVLKDAFTALCATKKEILRKGDVLAAASTSAWEAPWGRDDDEDVFYEGGEAAEALEGEDVEPKAGAGANAASRCVGCPVRGRAEFLCGSDNRTYSSLCRLDLHNCVRRPLRPVRLACRGFCPCRKRRARPHPDDVWRRRKAESEHNEVLPQRPARRRFSQGYEGCALDKMANRLLDWFSVLMDEAGASAPPEDGFPEDCKPEVRWMFSHLDTDGDGVLSASNLYSLRHDERERCLRPFLASCRVEGGGGGGVDRRGWCGCLRRAARPCTALARAHPNAKSAGAYVPSCDERGFYRPRQCHAALGVCWCVDAHGVERPHSRTKGAPACPEHERQLPSAAGADAGAAVEGAPADDEDADGSGDADLRF